MYFLQVLCRWGGDSILIVQDFGVKADTFTCLTKDPCLGMMNGINRHPLEMMSGENTTLCQEIGGQCSKLSVPTLYAPRPLFFAGHRQNCLGDRLGKVQELPDFSVRTSVFSRLTSKTRLRCMLVLEEPFL